MVPDSYDFFGLPVRFRTETRSGDKDTLVLSLWKIDFPLSHFDNPTSSMVLESTPMRLSKIKRDLVKISPESKNSSSTNTSSGQKKDLCIIDLALLKFLQGMLEHPSIPALANASPEESSLLIARQKKAQHDRDALLSRTITALGHNRLLLGQSSGRSKP